MCVCELCCQTVSNEVDKAKKSVLECEELTDKLQSSPISSEVAKVILGKQIRELRTLAADVDDEWTKKRTELETKLSHLENYQTLYQV